MQIPLYTESRGLGPDLVLLHGWGLNSGVWEPISHALQRTFRVTTIDLPGFGRNAELFPQPYTLENLAKAIAPHIPQDSILLGWSLGGLVAQQIALNNAEALRALVLVASTPRFAEADDWAGIRATVLEVFEQQLERDFSKTLDRFLAIQALGAESARNDIKVIRQHVQHYPIPDDHALQAGLKILASADLRDKISGISIPTCKLYGRLDSLVPAKAAHAIEALQPDAIQYTFAHASHAPFISHPDLFLDVLLEKLGKLAVI